MMIVDGVDHAGMGNAGGWSSGHNGECRGGCAAGWCGGDDGRCDMGGGASGGDMFSARLEEKLT